MSALRRLRLRTAWAQVRHAPGRVASSVLAVACGVALAASILLVGEEIPAAIERSVQAVVGRADLRVVATSPAGLDESLLPNIAMVPGVAVAAPVVSVPSFFDDDAAEQLTVWGIDLLNESALGIYGMESGDGVDVGDPLTFASRPDSAIAAAGLLQRRNARQGDTVRIVTPAGVKSLVLRGSFRDTASPRAGLDSVLIMDVYSAQILFDRQGLLTHVDVLLAEGAEPGEVAARLAAAVGPQGRVVPAGTRHVAAQSMMAGALLLIRGMSLCGLFLAALLTFNRLSTVFFARQWEVGISRALGASPRVATLELLKEALLVGLVGSLVGMAAGGILARFVAPMLVDVAQITSATSLPKLDVALRTGPLVISGLLGIVVTLAGAFVPARRAARATVSAVLRGRGLEEVHEGKRPPGWVLAAALLLLSGALLWLERRTHAAIPGFAAILSLVLAAGVLVRPLVELAARRLTPLAARLAGPVGRLATRDVELSSRGTAGSARLLSIGLGIVLFFQILVPSFQAALSFINGGSRRADLIVASAYDIGGDMASLSEQVLDELRAIPGVAAAGAERALFGAEFGVSAFDGAQLRDPRLAAWVLDGSLGTGALARVAAGEALLVTPGFALHRGVGVGDRVSLTTPTGPLELPVTGIASASTYSNRGDVVLAREVYRHFWKDGAITRAHVAVDAGLSPDTVRSRIVRELGAKHHLRIFTPAELASYYERIVARGAACLGPMLLLTLVVVVLGIADSLLATVLERTREIGIMRALGASPAAVGRFVVVQAAFVTLLGTLLAPMIALGLAFALLRVTSMSVLGWQQDIVFDALGFASLMAVGIAAVLAGASIPTWRATRLTPTGALAE